MFLLVFSLYENQTVIPVINQESSFYKLHRIIECPSGDLLGFTIIIVYFSFSYGREDEEVMGLRFCNEAIMSLHQIWPRKEEISKETLSPLQVSK